MAVHTLLVPPLNFAMVLPEIYRSGYPNQRNYTFLDKLKLKTVIYIGTDGYSSELCEYWSKSNVRLYTFPLVPNREPFVEMDEQVVASVLSLALDSRNLPALIHCNKGKHRVGCVAGIIRRIQGWSIAAIFDEYKRFCAPKVRMVDQEFIELYERQVTVNRAYLPRGTQWDVSSLLEESR